MDNWPDEDRCSEADLGLAVSDLDFFTLLPPLAGCLPLSDDTDTTTSVDTPSCSEISLFIITNLNIFQLSSSISHVCLSVSVYVC